MINAAFVRECKPRVKMYEVTCDALPGFILRVLPTGKKVALVRYRVAGKDHRERIGLLGPTLSLDEARRRAAIMLASVAADEGDGATTSATTAGTRAPVKQVEPARSQIETLRSLAERFIRVHVDVRLKPGTAERYRQNIRDVILLYREIEDKPAEDNETAGKPTEDKPTFGERDFRSIKRSEINALHASLSKTPAAANSVLGTISSMFTWIYEDRELPDLRNPAFGIERFPLKKRERFLTPEERQRVQAVIDAGLKIPAGRKGHLHIATVWAFDLLGLTGRRRNEIVLLKWEMVNWQHAFLDLPDTKGGQLDAAQAGAAVALAPAHLAVLVRLALAGEHGARVRHPPIGRQILNPRGHPCTCPSSTRCRTATARASRAARGTRPPSWSTPRRGAAAAATPAAGRRGRPVPWSCDAQCTWDTTTIHSTPTTRSTSARRSGAPRRVRSRTLPPARSST